MKTLVTGATGFVGRHLVARLPEAMPLTRETADLTRPLKDLPVVEAIVHCAAEIDQSEAMREVNVEGTRRLVQWARANDVRHFVYLSTGGMDGLYAETKREAESIALDASGSLHVQVLRLFFPYGPDQAAQRLVPRMIASVRDQIPIRTGPKGGPRLSLTWIDDVVESIVRSLELEGAHRMDVGGPACTIHEVACTIGSLFGVAPVFSEQIQPSIDLVADSEPLRDLINFTPQTTLEDGLRRFVQ